MGLLSGLQGMMARANTGTPEKPSFVDRLNTFGASLQDISDGGDRLKEIQKIADEKQKTLQEQEQRKQISAIIDQLGLSPKEKLLFLANPKAFGELLQAQESPFTVSEGETRYGADGRPIVSVPKTMTFGNQILSVGQGGVNPLFTRPKTYEEMHRETQDTLNNDFERDRIGISRGQLGVAQGNLGLSRERLNREKSGGGALGQMSTDQLISLARSLK